MSSWNAPRQAKMSAKGTRSSPPFPSPPRHWFIEPTDRALDRSMINIITQPCPQSLYSKPLRFGSLTAVKILAFPRVGSGKRRKGAELRVKQHSALQAITQGGGGRWTVASHSFSSNPFQSHGCMAFCISRRVRRALHQPQSLYIIPIPATHTQHQHMICSRIPSKFQPLAVDMASSMQQGY